MSNKQYRIIEPKKKSLREVAFELNSEDYTSEMIRKISKFIKDNGYEYKYWRSYSKVKTMSFGCFRVDVGRHIYPITWNINEKLAIEIIEKALSNN